MNPNIARIRALLGGLFALLGLFIGIQLILRPGGINQKLMGLAFSAVLIGLGLVRIRAYFRLMRSTRP